MSKLQAAVRRRCEPQTATLRGNKTTWRTFVLPAALMNASSSPRRWLSAPERLSRRLSRSSRDHALIVITRSINLHSTAPSSPLHQLNTLSRDIKHWEFSGWYEWSSCQASGTRGNEDEIGSTCPQLTPAGRWRWFTAALASGRSRGTDLSLQRPEPSLSAVPSDWDAPDQTGGCWQKRGGAPRGCGN